MPGVDSCLVSSPNVVQSPVKVLQWEQSFCSFCSSSGWGGWHRRAGTMGLCGPYVAGDHGAWHCLGLARPPPGIHRWHLHTHVIGRYGFRVSPIHADVSQMRTGNTQPSIYTAWYKLQTSGLPFHPFLVGLAGKVLAFSSGILKASVSLRC